MSTLRRRLDRTGSWGTGLWRRLRDRARLVAAMTAGRITVRELQRVGSISGDLAKINISDEYGQIVQQRDLAEIAQLVGNINVSLDMLDRERRFASTIAHEIRSPLAGIRVTVEEALSDPDQVDYSTVFARVLRGVDRVEALATDLLLIARSRATEIEWARIDLCELVRREVAARADPIPVEVICAPGVLVKAMPTQIGEIVTNLLDNAQRYARQQVQIRVDRSGRMARLSVCDDGPGVPEKDRKRVFDRLYRLTTLPEPGSTSTGLGLAITWEIVRAHRGSVWVETAPSGGACFTVQLPLAAALGPET
ncbi:HAMP domain-containing histidine kinase [Nonomuraea terrae]|uniref:histidine kinase n=2 Tax=Nonomuraea terrae TaxID=2530383 RepID=A0A4V2YJR0_9ACTN|nr:HAMP domain-containing histidine kinase [Nonomuraea terrae]